MLAVNTASESNLSDIVALHKQQYSRSHFTSLLPDHVLGRYYEYFLRDKCVIIISEAKDGDKTTINGFVACGEEIPNKIAVFKKANRAGLFLAALLNLSTAVKKVIGDIYYKFFDMPVTFTEAKFLIISIVSKRTTKGIGKALLEKCCAVAINMGHSSIGLYVRVCNLGALKFYLRNGFLIIGYVAGQFYMELKIGQGTTD